MSGTAGAFYSIPMKGSFVLAMIWMLTACTSSKHHNLQSELDAKKKQFELLASEEKKKTYQEGIDKVEASGVLEQAIQKGEKAPDFVLTNATGDSITLYSYLKNGPVILTWYRGGWCPYCNITLAALQRNLDSFRFYGANLLALTPELPDKSLDTKEKHNLDFEVLSDVGNVVARQYGIVYKLDEKVAEMYRNSFDLTAYNGDDSDELPLAATYVIDRDGTVAYAFLDADYRKRAEPSEILSVLRNLAASY